MKFPFGITDWLRSHRRIDGGWYIAMIRQLQVCLCTTDAFFTAPKRLEVASAFEMCIKVHGSLRLPVRKDGLALYQADINELLRMTVDICTPSTPSLCKSIKYHWPRHWAQTRIDIGCAPQEKSLERKLGETHKKYFKFTNKKGNREVCRSPSTTVK